MSENAFLPTCSKKRKIEYVFEGDNTDEPLLSHDYSYDNQQTESQQTATELFDLTIFNPDFRIRHVIHKNDRLGLLYMSIRFSTLGIQ